MMQNPLFPPSAPGNDSAAANPPIPDYLQTRQVQGGSSQPLGPRPGFLPAASPQSSLVPAPHPLASGSPQSNPSLDLTLERAHQPEYSYEKVADPNKNAAADLIRQKLSAIYAAEPNAHAELDHIEAAGSAAPLSKHQQYMQMLNESGKQWAEIQNDWHAYYVGLPDDEKHQVWQEFYSSGSQQTIMPGAQPSSASFAPQSSSQTTKVHVPTPVHVDSVQPTQWQPMQSESPGQPLPSAYASGYHAGKALEQPAAVSLPDATNQPVIGSMPGARILPDSRASNLPSVADIKEKVLSRVSAAGQSKHKQHFQSLAFGVMTGTAAVLMFMLLFFNEVVIAPFIQPSRTATETPIIVDTASAIVSKEPKVIIPKINVEIPVDYTLTTTNEAIIQKALNNGVIHYPTTVRPGQAGNAAFFGHSSNNILNPGKYKFAFLLLNKLREGDTFYLTYEGKAYAYEVFSIRVVEPTEIGVLGPVPNEISTATLITCDPPGTSLKRLVVVGRQTSPDPAGNTAPPAAPSGKPVQTAVAASLPSNGPTLWSRMWNSVF